MQILEAVGLGIVQGLTEFIPVSSSGHLILFENFFGLDAQKLLGFDIIVHAGTLLALTVLFWHKLIGILKGDWKLLAQLVIATIPATILGLLYKDFLEENLRSVQSVAIAFIIVGIYFLLAEKLRKQKDLSPKRTWWQVVGMGLAQAVAIIPGISRSGTTVATGTLLGLRRDSSAEFSFLMLMPVACGALLLVLAKGETNALPATEICLTGFAVSAIVSFLAARFMLSFFRRFGLNYFAYYLLFLGILLVWF